MQGWEIRTPNGWIDKSMLIMSAPGPGAHGVTANLVVTQDSMPAGLPAAGQQRYDALIDLHYNQMRDQLTRCKALERIASPDQNPPFGEISVEWVAPQGPLGQWVRWIEAGDNRMLVATGTAGRDDLEAHVPIFRKMIKTLRPIA